MIERWTARPYPFGEPGRSLVICELIRDDHRVARRSGVHGVTECSSFRCVQTTTINRLPLSVAKMQADMRWLRERHEVA